MDNNTIAEKIKTTLDHRGETLNSLAEKAGIPYVTLNRYLIDDSNITVKRLTQIAKALDVSVTDLLPTSKTTTKKKENQ